MYTCSPELLYWLTSSMPLCWAIAKSASKRILPWKCFFFLCFARLHLVSINWFCFQTVCNYAIPHCEFTQPKVSRCSKLLIKSSVKDFETLFLFHQLWWLNFVRFETAVAICWRVLELAWNILAQRNTAKKNTGMIKHWKSTFALFGDLNFKRNDDSCFFAEDSFVCL